MLSRPPTVGIALLVAVSSALAADIRFSDSTIAENRASGQKVVTTRATNEADVPRTVTVTSGGWQYNVGTLEPGKAAKVTVIEQVGKQPVILFDREKPGED
jgi:hypothetical protein